MDIEKNNKWYKDKFSKVFNLISGKYPSLCGYYLFGSLKKGSDFPSDVDAIYLFDSKIEDLSPEKRIFILDNLERICKDHLGIPINRYDTHIYDEAESAFADVSGNDFKQKIGYLFNYFPDLKLTDFTLTTKTKPKLRNILKKF